MPRRRQTQDEAAEQAAQQTATEQAGRRGRRRATDTGAEAATAPEQQAPAEQPAPEQSGTEEPTRAEGERPPRKERKPRVHEDLLTVAYRGPLANKFRELAERHGLSLARLLQDALLAYEASVAAGYQPGTALAEWKAEQTQASTDA